eukprot:CAMPEP_0170402012 /NCGR_PEP_ID=MMETSP0117_2-20130122/25328_1 /TAXON_ID=400756 /ORGANISM="Durinskia baltica, Strain CSIRO CS-38" /LENGTH=53 /DNA_ID=CAMNT_0010658847 /DNA_START=57 /DNA_END=218 /DNA_ORIENTATION=-
MEPPMVVIRGKSTEEVRRVASNGRTSGRIKLSQSQPWGGNPPPHDREHHEGGT